MNPFDCYLVSPNDSEFIDRATLDTVPRARDYLCVEGTDYRVLDVYFVQSSRISAPDTIYLSVELVPIPEVFAKAKRERVADPDLQPHAVSPPLPPS